MPTLTTRAACTPCHTPSTEAAQPLLHGEAWARPLLLLEIYSWNSTARAASYSRCRDCRLCGLWPAGQQRKHRVPCGGTTSQRELSLGVLFKPLNFQVSTFLLVDFFITNTSTDQTRTRSVSKQCHALKRSSISLAVIWPTSACCKIKYPFLTTDAERELSKTSLNTVRPFLGAVLYA